MAGWDTCSNCQHTTMWKPMYRCTDSTEAQDILWIILIRFCGVHAAWMLLSIKQRGVNEILRHSEIRSFFCLIIQLIISFLFFNQKLKIMQIRSIFTSGFRSPTEQIENKTIMQHPGTDWIKSWHLALLRPETTSHGISWMASVVFNLPPICPTIIPQCTKHLEWPLKRKSKEIRGWKTSLHNSSHSLREYLWRWPLLTRRPCRGPSLVLL